VLVNRLERLTHKDDTLTSPDNRATVGGRYPETIRRQAYPVRRQDLLVRRSLSPHVIPSAILKGVPRVQSP
jgi:hypothetical protein